MKTFYDLLIPILLPFLAFLDNTVPLQWLHLCLSLVSVLLSFHLSMNLIRIDQTMANGQGISFSSIWLTTAVRTTTITTTATCTSWATLKKKNLATKLKKTQSCVKKPGESNRGILEPLECPARNGPQKTLDGHFLDFWLDFFSEVEANSFNS